MNFAEYDPCLYKGKILCEDCSKAKTCDMRLGRELHRMTFEAGYKFGLEDRDPPNSHCFYHGGQGCMNQRFLSGDKS